MSNPTTIEEALDLIQAVKVINEDTGDEQLATTGHKEALATIEQLVLERVIGESPENPYSTRDAFMHDWGRQASEYDKHIRAMQRQALTQLLQGDTKL